ncbi:MAG: hypothetical protein WC346_18405 [Methanogenium sp.]|jgi:hypothetical protein
MANIKKFDNQNLTQLRQEIDIALRKIGNDHGVALSIGRIRYDSETFSTKLIAAIVSQPNPNTPNTTKTRTDVQGVMFAKAVKELGQYYGVKSEDIGKRVTIDGQNSWTFIGINPRGRRMPYIYENLNGRRIKSTQNYVNLAWKK